MSEASARIVIQFTPSELQLVEDAARRAGTSPANYVRETALRAAQGISSTQPLQLPAEEWDEFADAIAHPGRMNEGLARLLSHPSVLARGEPTHPVPADMSTAEALTMLENNLGRELMAITLGATPTALASWISGELQVPAAEERRLRDALQVWQLVVSVESIETTRAWWMGIEEQLGDLSPAEAIASDRAGAVMSIAGDFVEGG
ncbi:DUF1778 domain-containing protein [Agrococcus sp. 1P02AA]|uniref:type II toxin-antitoxin system TacA family antitoxin n=1 Tax=Agrococcus sp. 1P02AA TaxID=3132259 RepID=UPI0039A6C2EE